jgi:tRNA dimethylallyltransferase
VYEEGVINEVRQVLGLQLSRTARQVHGLSDIEQYLASECSLRDMMAAWQQRVRNYARRQLIWFRQTAGLHWLDVAEDERPWETASRVLDALRRVRHEAVPVAA